MTTPYQNAWDAAFRRALGEGLRMDRQDQGMTQADVARSVGITQASLSHYENGKRDISFRVMSALGEVLGFDLEEAANGAGIRASVALTREVA